MPFSYFNDTQMLSEKSGLICVTSHESGSYVSHVYISYISTFKLFFPFTSQLHENNVCLALS